MPHAAFKSRRKIKVPESYDRVTKEVKPAREEQENGLIVFSGGNSTNLLIRDWIDQKELKKNQSKNFEEKDLKIAMNATAYDLAPFVSK
jgi:hypothetical protein